MEQNSRVESWETTRTSKINLKGSYWREGLELETDKLCAEDRGWFTLLEKESRH